LYHLFCLIDDLFVGEAKDSVPSFSQEGLPFMISFLLFRHLMILTIYLNHQLLTV